VKVAEIPPGSRLPHLADSSSGGTHPLHRAGLEPETSNCLLGGQLEDLSTASLWTTSLVRAAQTNENPSPDQRMSNIEQSILQINTINQNDLVFKSLNLLDLIWWARRVSNP